MTQQQIQARSLYFQSDLSQNQIADIIGINRKTLYIWITKGKWTRTRNIDNLTPMRLIQQYYTHLENLNIELNLVGDKCPGLEDCKRISKLAGVIKILTPKHSQNQYCAVMHEFLSLFKKESPELCNQLMPYIVNFLASKDQNFPLEDYFTPTLQVEPDNDGLLSALDNSAIPNSDNDGGVSKQNEQVRLESLKTLLQMFPDTFHDDPLNVNQIDPHASSQPKQEVVPNFQESGTFKREADFDRKPAALQPPFSALTKGVLGAMSDENNINKKFVKQATGNAIALNPEDPTLNDPTPSEDKSINDNSEVFVLTDERKGEIMEQALMLIQDYKKAS